MNNLLEESVLDIIFQLKILKSRRTKFHKEAVSRYGPLYFTHPDYLESNLGLCLNATCNFIKTSETKIKKSTNQN